MEMQLVLVSVNQLIKTPRSPPGPSYVAKDISTNDEELGLTSKSIVKQADKNLFGHKKLMLMVLQDENLEKQFEALELLQLLTKPQSLGLNQYISEEETV